MHEDYWIGIWKHIPLFDCVDQFVIPCVGKSLEFHENPVFLNSFSLSVAVISIKNHAIEVPNKNEEYPSSLMWVSTSESLQWKRSVHGRHFCSPVAFSRCS